MTARTKPVTVDRALLRRWTLPFLRDDADKDARGSLLVVAGSAETPGAASLAATAALRAGCGKLVVATVASIAPGLALCLPESRVISLAERKAGGFAARGHAKLFDAIDEVDALLVGPGLCDGPDTCALVEKLLDHAGDLPVTLDAAAIDVARRVGRFEHLRLLTPHAGEMARLTGVDKATIEAEPLRHARVAAERFNAIVVAKGACTLIAMPDGRCWRHDGGRAGLAASGSGDVLAGVIAGLASRGADLAQAAAWGIFLHAEAGRALAEAVAPLGFLARELPGAIPRLLASTQARD